MTDTVRYHLVDLYAHNRELAERYPEMWSKFRWRYRFHPVTTDRNVLNEAFEQYRLGWYDHILYAKNHATQS
jgi:hypothetical protein